MPTNKARKDRAAFSCARQKIVATYVQEIQDLFCSGFATLEPGARLVAQTGRAETPSDRFRNAMRMLTVGCIVRLGLDLGLSAHSMHGQMYGTTEIVELVPIHYATSQSACALFDALLADEGEFAYFVAGRYADILQRAKADVKALHRPTRKRHGNGKHKRKETAAAMRDDIGGKAAA